MNGGHLLLTIALAAAVTAWRMCHRDLLRARRQRDRLWSSRREATLERQRIVADLVVVSRERDELAATLDALTGQRPGAFDEAVRRHPVSQGLRVINGGQS